MLSPFQFASQSEIVLDNGYITCNIDADGVPRYALTKRGLARWIFKKLGVKIK